MKKLFFWGVIAAVMAACASPQPQEGYTVNVKFTGDLSKVENRSMVLLGGTMQHPEADTAAIVNGQVSFHGIAHTPTSYSLFFAGRRYPFLPVFVENARYDITIDLAKHIRKAEIRTDAPVQSFLNLKARKVEAYEQEIRYDSIMNAVPRNQELVSQLYSRVRNMEDSLDQAYRQANPMSPFTLCHISEDIERIPLAEVEALLDKFEAMPEFAKNRVLAEALQSVKKIKSLQRGKQAPDFTQNDIKGHPVTLSEVYRKNKVTMVDFWASWCGPCRRFNPTLLKIYEKYHKKGFEIVAVSLDSKQDAWEKGVKEDRLPWIHVSNLSKWDNPVGKLYFVHFVPQNIFMDRNGKILARHADEEEIIRLLEENL